MSRTLLTQAAATTALALSLSLAASLPAMAADALRVVQDPVSGELRPPTAAEAAAFDKAQAALGTRTGKAQAKGLVEIRHPDGSIETKLGEDTRMYSVVSSEADGSLTFDCLPAEEAKKFVKSKKQLSSKTAAAKKVGQDDHQH